MDGLDTLLLRKNDYAILTQQRRALQKLIFAPSCSVLGIAVATNAPGFVD